MPENTEGQTRQHSIPTRHGQFSNGRVEYDATSITAADYTEVDVGYRPRYVKWVNATDRVTVEWHEGMAANTCLKTAANGARTLETTNGGVTVTDGSFRVLQNATLAAIAASKVCYWVTQA